MIGSAWMAGPIYLNDELDQIEFTVENFVCDYSYGTNEWSSAAEMGFDNLNIMFMKIGSGI